MFEFYFSRIFASINSKTRFQNKLLHRPIFLAIIPTHVKTVPFFRTAPKNPKVTSIKEFFFICHHISFSLESVRKKKTTKIHPSSIRPLLYHFYFEFCHELRPYCGNTRYFNQSLHRLRCFLSIEDGAIIVHIRGWMYGAVSHRYQLNVTAVSEIAVSSLSPYAIQNTHVKNESSINFTRAYPIIRLPIHPNPKYEYLPYK